LPEPIEKFLRRDPEWAAYALADLDEPLFSRCSWQQSEAALLLSIDFFDPPYIFTMGDAAELRALLAAAPHHGIAMMETHHRAAFEQCYAECKLRPMRRMKLQQLKAVHGESIILTAEHATQLEALYALGPVDDYHPSQLNSGFFRGVLEDGQLIAAAGVHVASPQRGVADIGSVFTHPQHRGRGLAARCTSRVVSDLLQSGVSTIILNVEENNDTARRVYERLGFVDDRWFLLGMVSRPGLEPGTTALKVRCSTN
jgi:ribosomal protein S18 acetylase RimI-like enzyme